MRYFAAILPVMALAAASVVHAQTTNSPLPDIIKAFGGHWMLTVRFEKASGVPPGSDGTGEESWRAAVDGKTLLSEEAWKAGPVSMSLLGVIWWNYRDGKLHAMDCNNQGKNICEAKDAADAVAVRWDGRQLTIEEPEKGPDGKMITSRITFKDIQDNSFSEVNSVSVTPGKFEDVMTIHAVRAAK